MKSFHYHVASMSTDSLAAFAEGLVVCGDEFQKNQFQEKTEL